jgi:hypothetical protein
VDPVAIQVQADSVAQVASVEYLVSPAQVDFLASAVIQVRAEQVDTVELVDSVVIQALVASLEQVAIAG